MHCFGLIDMSKKILDFIEKELRRNSIEFERKRDEFVVNKGTRLESSFYVEGEEKDMVTVGVTFKHKIHYAVALKYDGKIRKVVKFRVIVPNVSTYEGKTVEKSFLKLLLICVLISEQIFESKINPNIATLEQIFEK